MSRVRRAVRCGAILLATSGVWTTASWAQEPFAAAAGFMVMPSVSVGELRGGCLTGLRIGTVAPVDTLPCEVTEELIFDTTGVWAWEIVRYRRGARVDYDEFVDTLDIDELLLAAVDRSAGQAYPIWHTVRDRTYEFLTTVRWQRRSNGTVLGILVCLNGTGGCFEELLLLGEGLHVAVVAQEFIAELAERAPEGYALHKGRQVDLETLTGEQPLAGPGDGNCCPSGLMRFRLRFEGHRLQLVRAEVVRP